MRLFKIVLIVLVGYINSVNALNMSVVGPCDQRPLLEVFTELKDRKEVTLGDLTVKVLNDYRIPFKGDAHGIAQIFDSPVGQEAIEVLNPTQLRAYGWCVHVDDLEPAEMPDQVVITEQVKKIHWFYAFSLYDNGEWKEYCTPSWKVHSLSYCQNININKK